MRKSVVAYLVGLVVGVLGHYYLGDEKIVHAPAEIIVKTDTLYRDTCDSKFFKTIAEIESGAISMSKLDSCYLQSPVLGDGGRAKGHFQIHDVCVQGTMLNKVLGYNHDNMFDLESGSHVFWSMMGIFSHYYYQKHKEYPSYEKLARMWCGGPLGYQKTATDRYAKKFNEVYKKKL